MSADTPIPSETPAYNALTKKEREWVDTYFTMGRNATAVSRSMGYKAPRKHGWRMSTNVHIQDAIAEKLDRLEIRANDVLYRINERANTTGEDFLRFETKQARSKVWAPVSIAVEEKRFEVEVEREMIARLELTGDDRKAADKDLERLERQLVRLEVIQEEDPGRHVRIRGPVRDVVEASFDLGAMRDAGKLHLVKAVSKTKEGTIKVEMHDAAHADDVLAKHLGLLTEKVDVTSAGAPLAGIEVTIHAPRSRGERSA